MGLGTALFGLWGNNLFTTFAPESLPIFRIVFLGSMALMFGYLAMDVYMDRKDKK